jgi:hypothetical protein
LQANLDPDSLEVTAKLALVWVVLAGGWEVIVVSGGVVSQVRRRLLRQREYDL